MPQWEYLCLRREMVYETTGLLSGRLLWRWDDENKNDKNTLLSVQNRLNQLGEQGWELVSMIPVSDQDGASIAGRTSSVRFIFKRPKGT